MGNAGISPSPAPGVTGRAVVPRLASAPAHTSIAGYAPEHLDKPIASALGVTEKHIAIARNLGKKVEQAMSRLDQENFSEHDDPLELMGQMVTMHEKMSRSGAQLVKCIDELSRLRSFIGGGPDSRPDLSSKGEQELKQMIFETVDAMGYTLVPKATVLEAEVV